MYQLRYDRFLPKREIVKSGEKFESLRQVHAYIRSNFFQMIKMIYQEKLCAVLSYERYCGIPMNGWISITIDGNQVKLINDPEDEYYERCEFKLMDRFNVVNDQNNNYTNIFDSFLKSKEISEKNFEKYDNVYKLECDKHKFVIKLELPSYFVKYDRAFGGYDESPYITPYYGRGSNKKMYHSLGEIYHNLKQYISSYPCILSSNPHTEITILLSNGSFINVNDHLRVICNGELISLRTLRQENTFSNILSDIPFHQNIVTHRTTDNIVNVKFDQFEYKSEPNDKCESLKIVFDFPDYFKCFKSLLLISLRYNIHIPRDVLKIIMLYM